jgi:hypothetical protein
LITAFRERSLDKIAVLAALKTETENYSMVWRD